MSTWSGGESCMAGEERARKRLARIGHKQSHDAQNLRGIRAKMMQEKRRVEKIQMRKQIKALEERNVMTADDSLPSDPVPHYLLDRNHPSAAKALAPMGLRQKFAHVSHPTLGVTVKAPILSVKKNPQDPMYTRLGVLTRGTVVEVNVSDLGLTTTTGKCVWGRYAQITNNPEEKGTVNATPLV
ncbi:Ribosome biogenesis protein NSA2 [Colletotrichum kahawae]|uniref:Ribosome biogenesis protein NSA2 n=1 Tax=Colletotrichum kahawae TaxID=34407 RepID=A0AAD9YC28_COLKA|nr:Ribosome biogenesis protein NSA2 [Colletotrichum kahawae]